MKTRGKLLSLFFFLLLGIRLNAKSYALFPFCAENAQKQSERLNNLHILILDAAGKVSSFRSNLLGKDFKNTECEISKRRNLAALLNTEEFLEGTYMLKGDSVIISMKFVYTQFIDKFGEQRKAIGLSSDFNSVIKSTLSNVFKDLDIHPSPEEWMLINALVKEDEKKYSPASSVGEIDYFEIGMTAYKIAKYQEAKDNLSNVPPTHPKFTEACFYLAKSLLYFSDFSGALNYLNICKEKGAKIAVLDEYIQSVKKLNHPADYYDTEAKRKQWWISLDKESIKAIISLLNNLKINGKSFDEKYEYDDKDIAALFNTSILAISDYKLPSFEVYRHFTKVDLMILQNSTLKSDAGVEFFVRLKMIRTDNAELLKKEQIAKLISDKGIKTFIQQNNQ